MSFDMHSLIQRLRKAKKRQRSSERQEVAGTVEARASSEELAEIRRMRRALEEHLGGVEDRLHDVEAQDMTPEERERELHRLADRMEALQEDKQELEARIEDAKASGGLHKGELAELKAKKESLKQKLEQVRKRIERLREAERSGAPDRVGLEADTGIEGSLAGGQEAVDKEDVDVKYPLIPRNPREDEDVFAWAHITYDERKGKMIYNVYEPDLPEHGAKVLEDIEEELKQKIDVDFGAMKRGEAKDFLMNQIDDIMQRKDFDVTEREKKVIQYYAYRNFVGLGKIEPVMRDKYVEDISCDGTGVPVYIYHRDPDVGSVQSNLVFPEKDDLDNFVRKLAQRCGRSLSMAEPLLDGSLPDGSRVQATLGTDIARRGSNFTIRRFTEEPLTPIDLYDFGTLDASMLAYLWLAIENGRSVLIAGPTAAGKTTLLNALSLFIPPELKIVSIEDTPELRLPHPNWVPEVARSGFGFGFGETQTGEVTLDDLLKESLRQRPDYIIVGEVRGAEAYILFQQMATGHPGMSTIHANNLQRMMSRLRTKPMDLSGSLIENLDIVLFTKRIRRKGEYVRRVTDVYELEGYDTKQDTPEVNKIFQWDAKTDEFELANASSILARIADDRGVAASTLQSEISRRKRIIDWMLDQGIRHYTDVGRLSSQYYHHPESLLKRVEAETSDA